MPAAPARFGWAPPAAAAPLAPCRTGLGPGSCSRRRDGATPHTCGDRSHLYLQRHQAHLAALVDQEALGQVYVLAPLLGEELHHELAVHVYLVPVETEELLDQQLVAGAVRHTGGPREDGEAEEDRH